MHGNTNSLREPHPALKTVLLYGRQIQTRSSCVILTRCHVKTVYSPRATPCRVHVLQPPRPCRWNSEDSRGPGRIAPVLVASPALYKPTGVVTTLSRSWPTKRSDSTQEPISPRRALSTNAHPRCLALHLKSRGAILPLPSRCPLSARAPRTPGASRARRLGRDEVSCSGCFRENWPVLLSLATGRLERSDKEAVSVVVVGGRHKMPAGWAAVHTQGQAFGHLKIAVLLAK